MDLRLLLQFNHHFTSTQLFLTLLSVFRILTKSSETISKENKVEEGPFGIHF